MVAHGLLERATQPVILWCFSYNAFMCHAAGYGRFLNSV